MSDLHGDERLISELRSLRTRIAELQCTVQLLSSRSSPLPAAPLSGAIWGHEIFPAEITADGADGTYTARRLIATAANTFTTDPDDTAAITVGNVAERDGYTGDLSVGDIVLVRFDGLNTSGNAIYHVW